MTTGAKRGRGRPAQAGTAVSAMPKMMLYIEPDIKLRLRVASAVLNSPAWKLVNTAISEYLERLPAADRTAIDVVLRRIEARRSV